MHVPVFRYKRSFKNDNYLGGIYASREYDGGFNRLSGLDGSARIDQSTTLVYHALFSNTKTSVDDNVKDGHALGWRLARINRD